MKPTRSQLAKLICSGKQSRDGKQSRESVELPLTCHPSSSLTSFAFRSSEVRRILLDLDPYGGSDPLGMFPLFLKITAAVLSPRLSGVFRRRVRRVVSRLAGDRPLAPLFQRVHRPPLLPITDRFHNIRIVHCV